MFFRMVYKSGQYFYRFVTIHACDRRTDRQTDGQTDGQNSHHNTASALHAAR